MSDTNPNPQNQPDEAGIRDLRAKADRTSAAESRAEQLERELAFTQAGINTSNRFGKMVMDAHEGDITEEAVKATVAKLQEELGIKPPPAPEAGDDPDSPEARLQAARDQMQGGGAAPQEPPAKGSVEERSGKTYQQARAQGMDREDSMEVALGEYFRAAAEGDPSAVFNEEKWEAERAKVGHGAKIGALPLSSGDRDHPDFVEKVLQTKGR